MNPENEVSIEYVGNAELLNKWKMLLPSLISLLEALDTKAVVNAHDQILQAKLHLQTIPRKPAQQDTSQQLNLIHLDYPEYIEAENVLKNRIADFKQTLSATLEPLLSRLPHQIPELASALDDFCQHMHIKPVPLSEIGG